MAKLLIIGGVAGGMSTAAKAKRENPELEVVVYERTEHISYGACGMPYVLEGVIPSLSKLIARTPERMAREGVTAHVQHEVIAVDQAGRQITVKNLITGELLTDSYDTLVFATGARAVRPPLPGITLPGVHTLKSLADAAAIEARLGSAQRAVIVGGGYIGLEMAEALRQRGLNVTVVELLPQLLANFDPDIAVLAQEELAAHGVGVRLGDRVLGFSGNGTVEVVHTESGDLPAELVLLSVGVAPNSELAQAIGVALSPQGAILTDSQMRTNLPGVYAAGDVAAARHLVSSQTVWLPLGDTANKMGRVAGTVIAGKEARFLGVLGTAIVKVFDKALARTGLSSQEAVAAGFDFRSARVSSTDHAHYYPDKRPLEVKLLWDGPSQRLLGGQIVGHGDAVKRIDVLAALLFKQATIQDLADLDLAYAPPFSGVWDALLLAANVALAEA